MRALAFCAGLLAGFIAALFLGILAWANGGRPEANAHPYVRNGWREGY